MHKIINYDELFDTKTAAKYIGITNPRTLSVWKCTNRVDLKPIKVGGAVRYKRSVLDEYLSRTE